MYLPYLYQRPVLSSGRKLTKEYVLWTITLATDAEEEKRTRVQDSRATERTVQFLFWTRPHLHQDTQRGDGLASRV